LIKEASVIQRRVVDHAAEVIHGFDS